MSKSISAFKFIGNTSDKRDNSKNPQFDLKFHRLFLLQKGSETHVEYQKFTERSWLKLTIIQRGDLVSLNVIKGTMAHVKILGIGEEPICMRTTCNPFTIMMLPNGQARCGTCWS
jgi:hypothetical protein